MWKNLYITTPWIRQGYSQIGWGVPSTQQGHTRQDKGSSVPDGTGGGAGYAEGGTLRAVTQEHSCFLCTNKNKSLMNIKKTITKGMFVSAMVQT